MISLLRLKLFVTTCGEPAVRILADQVEEASSGSIRQSLVLPVERVVGVAHFMKRALGQEAGPPSGRN